MSQTGSYITSLVWETADGEGPTRSEYQINWNAMDGHLHDNRGAGRGVRGIQTTAAPTQAGDVQLTGDSLKYWAASAAVVKTVLPDTSPTVNGTAAFTQSSAGTANMAISNSSDNIGRISAGASSQLDLVPITGGHVRVYSPTNANYAWDVLESGGVVVGGATGGDKGAGTLNAKALFVNGSAATSGLLLSSALNTAPAGATYFIGNNLSTTESVMQIPMAVTFTFTKMYTNASQASGAGQSFAYTLRKNGVDTAITSTASNAASSNDTAHSVTFAPGDLIDIKLVVSAGATLAGHHIMLA